MRDLILQLSKSSIYSTKPSGGPIMTVERFDKSLDKYCCEWFSNGKRNSEMFKATSIQQFKPSVGIL
ncbi:TPA: DUF2158 domain-containing protein [Klebsiella pneumoniae]|nr:DUF2158 domain-containing protein [Klebsiella pneumoniae]